MFGGGGGADNPAGKTENSSGNLHLNNFIAPSSGKTEFHNTTAINIDGQQHARILEAHIARAHEMPDSASSSNGVAYNNLNDWNPRDS
jgi:hypothetical protein